MFIPKITAIFKCIKRNNCRRREKLLKLCVRRCLLKCISILLFERECACALIAVDVMCSHFPSYSSFICGREWKKKKKKEYKGLDGDLVTLLVMLCGSLFGQESEKILICCSSGQAVCLESA